MMSKLRQDIQFTSGDLSTPSETDLRSYVIFTQLKTDGSFIYAGWLDAVDDDMSLSFAREHYGQDQMCVHIWSVRREFVGGLRENKDAAREEAGELGAYQIFTQNNAGDQHVSAMQVTATCAADAIDEARRQIDHGSELHNIWAIPCRCIVSTDDDDLIWRHFSQDYRMARGYSKDVRKKWEHIRAQKDLENYEKDDLKEMF